MNLLRLLQLLHMIELFIALAALFAAMILNELFNALTSLIPRT